MKKTVRLFIIGLMMVVLSFTASQAFSQSKAKTIKQGSVYIGNVDSPQQIAAYGTPAWLFSTMSVSFIEGQCALSFNRCAYSINTYTGGLGNAMYSDNTEARLTACLVKDGKVYLWDPAEGQPKDETGYLMIFKINDDESLTLTKTSIDGLDLVKFVYMADYYKMKKMGNAELQQVEAAALTKLLRN